LATDALTPIEDYALIGDLRTAALVGRDGSIDWLCLPRFDSPACFAALLGTPDNGRWRIAPAGGARSEARRYRKGSLVLETSFETATGGVTVTDFMPHRGGESRVDVVRVVRGEHGAVPMELELRLRFDYGSVVPWVRKRDFGLSAVAGPDAVEFYCTLPLENRDFRSRAAFEVRQGETHAFRLTWHPSHHAAPRPSDPLSQCKRTDAWWRHWSGQLRYEGPWREAVERSLITLKALIYDPTGSIVAAPTTSLPEQLGGPRNWDYRYSWLRDATLTLRALVHAGYLAEAAAWRSWMVRAVAGQPEKLQIMYGIGGERRLTEQELPWLAGYGGSRPVRIGNAAADQLQLDTYGEMMDLSDMARRAKLEQDDEAWRVQKVLLEHLEDHWRDPDQGIWEVRGAPRHFTHSKIMAWVAVDRSVKAVEEFGLDGDAARWRTLRHEIHSDVCRHGFNAKRNSFVQYYGGEALDAALLMIPRVGFLPPGDPRVVGTVEAIERELMQGGFVLRYRTQQDVDGLPQGEGVFLACSFWLAEALELIGRHDDAVRLFERLLAIRNDVGLLAEEYDPKTKRHLGNFPQALSHIALVNAAFRLAAAS